MSSAERSRREVAELGNQRPHLPVRPPGPASRALAERLRRVESRNVTYQDTHFPVFWAQARGSNVKDADGNRYVDLTGAFGVAAAGHAHPRVVEAIERQARTLVHGMGDVHPPVRKVELLERLCDAAPWPEARGVLASSGSEAVEIALKTAQLATGRRGVVAFEGGYHGLTLGALAVTGRADFREPFRGRLPGAVDFVPFPHRSDGGEAAAGSLAALDRALAGEAEDMEPPGAVILEPIQGRGGVRIPPPGFLAEVRHRTHKAGAVLILDEIFTGLGRVGSFLALQDEGLIPDLLCLGKALGGGLPLSCCLGSREIMEAWPPSEGEALHTSTFLGHPLACASALAFLDVLESDDLRARAREEGGRFLRRLGDRLEGCDHVGEVRGRGMLLGVQLVRPAEGNVKGGASSLPWNGGGASAAVAALRRGILALPAGPGGDVLQLTPPLTTSRTLLEWAADALPETIRDLVPPRPSDED